MSDISPRVLGASRAGGLLAVLLFVALVGSARAQHVSFTASIEPQQASVGDPLRFRLTVEASDNVGIGELKLPNFGQLKQTGEVGRTSADRPNAQGKRVYQMILTWGLIAEAPGDYTVPPAQIEIDGRVYRTQPVKVAITKPPDVTIPSDLSSENILYAETNNATLNRQLRGKIFLRPEISNPNPWVGEPVYISYWLYIDKLKLASLDVRRQVPTNISGAVASVLVDPTRMQFQQREVGGRLFEVALAYRMAVTPNTAGRIEFDGMLMQVPLATEPDPFAGFSIFSNALNALLPTAKVVLDVKPLPQPAPADFSGSIGDFKVSGKLDRDSATEDDLITLSVTVEGRGAIELVNAPTLPEMPDFELGGQSSEVVPRTSSTDLGGAKTFEYILRPLRSGRLEIPPIRYATFSPYEGVYRSQEVPAQSIAVAPGKVGLRPQQAGGEDRNKRSAINDLQYLKPIERLQRERMEPLVGSPLFWGGQCALGALMCGLFLRRRRLDRLDPAQQRRARAWRAFERRMREMPANDPVRAIEVLDQAARGFIADRHNASAEGLTRPEIERLLRNGALTQERAERVCDLLDELQGLRYAPVQPTAADVQSRADALRLLLREETR